MLPKLCLITDRKQCNDILTVLEDALFGGVRMIQLREKDLSTVELYNIACKIR
ncbi:MAG: thiamine phosphate synthase, partial [Spirochaetota bacterium]|nr:thiamine phosphate synthase [Spirochaetota bacterium]